MFNLEIYRQHWAFFALAAGAVVVLSIVLWFLAVWRERIAEEKARHIEITDVKSFAEWFQRAFPWILILTLAGAFLFAIIYPRLRVIYPPNW